MTSECYRGVTIYKSTYPGDSRFSIWTTGVGGSGTQGYGSLTECKTYIDTLYNMGSHYSQCVPPIEPPVVPPIEPPTPKTDMEYTKYLIVILVIIILYYSFRK